ncbi:pyridoxamine 5'-phosphate oxidase family protein [Roseibium salinum]|uniref:Pyridoxamine 5'-phosphate oxidase family protein n=1 Tax=Roseibium salinum TaxID=1604349 RepID=A0ABT3R1C0_9HYPH|nr:pyridoxamine 5'-phosphate oxidase family protein [Roseibium sp. DSM 29163]MCX2722957.1 pyridoxamine 5'-phosphate oxidase family protein [Roseibium sp. DSM 29163]MDN3719104.1 pyridoxamine 5'-phosphate oxidase family protein [Roseibium salinum]
MTILSSLDALHAHYGMAGEASLIKEIGHLSPAYRDIVEASSFCALATCGPEGLDCSPRGDDGMVVRIRDDKTLLMPDRRGNNRIDSLRNIVRDPRVSLMFMVPGWNNVLRINGQAAISVEPDLLASFEKDGNPPRSVIVVTIERIYFQCARAIMRAGLWNPDVRIGKGDLPTPGRILQEIKEGFDGETYDKEWPERAAKSMW